MYLERFSQDMRCFAGLWGLRTLHLAAPVTAAAALATQTHIYRLCVFSQLVSNANMTVETAGVDRRHLCSTAATAAADKGACPPYTDPDALDAHVEQAWAHFRSLGSPQFHVAPMVDQVRAWQLTSCCENHQCFSTADKLLGQSAIYRMLVSTITKPSERVLAAWSIPYCAGVPAAATVSAVLSSNTQPQQVWMPVCLDAGNCILFLFPSDCLLQSELPFRMLCRAHGAQAAYTPMLHARLFLDHHRYRCVGHTLGPSEMQQQMLHL